MYICAILESMTFLRPEILTALFLLAIPLIVHLFEFRIFKPTEFTNLLFLEKLKNEQHRYRRLKKWLILQPQGLPLPQWQGRRQRVLWSSSDRLPRWAGEPP